MKTQSQLLQHNADFAPVAKRRDCIFLAWIVANCVLINLVLYWACHWLSLKGDLPDGAVDSCLPHLFRFFHLHDQDDSWFPMLKALHAWQVNPARLIYRDLFFSHEVKFQYPLSSLFTLMPLEHWHLTDAQVTTYANLCGEVVFALIAVACVVIAIESSRGADRSDKKCFPLTQAIATLLAVVCFYPLVSSYALGQIQSEIALLYCAVFYCWMRRWDRAAGVLIALMTLLKPQYALLLVWAALRKRWGLFWAGMVTASIGLSIAIAVFGWKNNLDYLLVLRALGRTGEGFLPNQSMNGLLNRLFYPALTLKFGYDLFPPFNPVVYAGTLASSLLLIGTSLIVPMRTPWKGSTIDFACMAVACIIASPVAWTHHYTLFLPIFVWLWFGVYRSGKNLRSAGWLVASYVLVSNYFSPANLFGRTPGANLLESYVYAGGLILLGLMFFLMKDAPTSSERWTAKLTPSR